jgi:hypothetical protein
MNRDFRSANVCGVFEELIVSTFLTDLFIREAPLSS